MEHVRIGTRSSKLALWQTNFIAEQLQKNFPSLKIEIIHIKTTGDRILNSPLSKIGGKGLFTKEIEIQLREHKIDFAVHSLKDIPAQLDENFSLAAITKRFDPFDAFVSNKFNSFQSLPNNATVGTSSLRRRAQILKLKPNLNVIDLRGNVDTRLKKLDEGNFDAIILACAGLKRLGYENRITQVLSSEIMLPAVGQGSLAIETLKNNFEVIDLLKFLDDFDSHVAANAERSFLKVVEGGCQVPIGVFAKVIENKLTVEAIISSIDGKIFIRDKIIGEIFCAEKIGETLAKNLLERGGHDILKRCC